MSTYIALVNWTDQGIRDYRETANRADAFAAASVGEHGVVAVRESADEVVGSGDLTCVGNLLRVTGKFLAEPDRCRVHKMGPTNLHDVPKFLRLCFERGAVPGAISGRGASGPLARAASTSSVNAFIAAGGRLPSQAVSLSWARVGSPARRSRSPLEILVLRPRRWPSPRRAASWGSARARRPSSVSTRSGRWCGRARARRCVAADRRGKRCRRTP